VRCHLGVAPQERTAEEHTTRERCTIRATCGRVILGGTVSRGWSLLAVLCEGGTCPVRTLMTNASRQRSSMSCSLVSMDVAGMDHSATCSPSIERGIATNLLKLRKCSQSNESPHSRRGVQCDERGVDPR
jgi:hypothetical protein